MDKQTIRFLVLISILVGVFLVVYNYFIADESGFLVSQKEAQTELLVRELVILQDRVQRIEMNTEILRSAAFQSLEDRTFEVPGVPKGRPNPFAPI